MTNPVPFAAEERVLIVESNPAYRLLTTSLMTARGFDVRTAADAPEALVALEHEHFRMILLDCGLPVLDGFEAATLIRSANLSGPNVCVVGMSAMLDDATRARGRAAGMDDLLGQPPSGDALDAVFARWNVQRPTRAHPTERPAVDPQMLELFAPLPGATENPATDLDAYHDALVNGARDIGSFMQLHELTSVQRVAHRLAGVALQIGANPLADQLRQIERAARANDVDAVATANREMRSELVRVEAVLRAYSGDIVANQKNSGATGAE